jgi:hypothetical protein
MSGPDVGSQHCSAWNSETIHLGEISHPRARVEVLVCVDKPREHWIRLAQVRERLGAASTCT